MKKFLLPLLALAMAAPAADATDYQLFPVPDGTEWTATDDGFTATMTVDGKSFTIVTAKSTSTNTLLVPTADQIRVYKNSEITITSADVTMKQVEMTATAANYGNAQTVEGWNQSYNESSRVLTITNEAGAESLTMKATANQFRIKTLVVSDEAGEIVEPTVQELEDLETLPMLATGTDFEVTTDLTVVYYYGAYVYLYDGTTTALAYYQAGGLNLKPGDIIAKGWKGSVGNYSGLIQMVPDAALTASSTGGALPTPKEITADDVATEFVAGNLSAYVTLKDVVFADNTPATGAYTGTMGETTVAFYNRFANPAMEAGTCNVTGFIAVNNSTVQLFPTEFDGISEVKLPVVESLSTLSDAVSGTTFEMGADLTVIYSSGSYTYVTDGTTNALIYKSNTGLTAGDVIAKGWDATFQVYNGLNEIVPSGTLAKADETGEIPNPTVVDEDASSYVAVSNQGAYLKLVKVVFDAATPSTAKSFTGTMGEESITFYNRFTLSSVAAGTYDVIGFVAVNYSNAQFYPISFTDGTSAISDINAEDAPAVYYNLQGIEVANPEAGNVYIRVQGNKATKVIR